MRNKKKLKLSKRQGNGCHAELLTLSHKEGRNSFLSKGEMTVSDV